MTRTRVIRVFSFFMALTLVFAMFSAPAYAVSKQQLGAWVMSAIAAINITWNSTVAPYYQGLDYFVDPFQLSDYGTFESVPYTYDSVDQILANNILKIKGETITIDGKDYTNIWLSHDAAEKFRVNAFDIKTAFEIASNSSGTFVSGVGNVDGIPFFEVGDFNESQTYLIDGLGSYRTGPFIYNALAPTEANRDMFLQSIFNGETTNHGNQMFPNKQQYRANFDNHQIGRRMNTRWDPNSSGSWSSWRYWSLPASSFDDTPFDFDWVSQEIPADQVLPSDYGLNIYVPSNPSQWSSDPATQQIINNYNTFVTNNPEFSPGLDVDLDDSGIMDKLGDLMDILGPLIELLKPHFGPAGEEPEPPEPPVPPVPPTGDLIPDTPWSSLENLLNRIISWLTDIDTTLSNIFTRIQTMGNAIISSINNLDTYLRNILQSFYNVLQNIANYLEDILDQLSDLIDNLLNHDVEWFDDIVDSIKRPFMRWFGILKSGVSIWHYVVEWLQYISSPFTFFFSILTNMGGIYVSPFYAVAAAYIVIAIYRRFGR